MHFCIHVFMFLTRTYIILEYGNVLNERGLAQKMFTIPKTLIFLTTAFSFAHSLATFHPNILPTSGDNFLLSY